MHVNVDGYVQEIFVLIQVSPARVACPQPAQCAGKVRQAKVTAGSDSMYRSTSRQSLRITEIILDSRGPMNVSNSFSGPACAEKDCSLVELLTNQEQALPVVAEYHMLSYVFLDVAC